MAFTNITEITDELAAQFEFTKVQAEAVANFLVQGFVEELKVRGNRVYLHGFGSFVPNLKPARTGRNPKTGASIQVPAKATIKFKPSSTIVTKDSK